MPALNCCSPNSHCIYLGRKTIKNGARWSGVEATRTQLLFEIAIGSTLNSASQPAFSSITGTSSYLTWLRSFAKGEETTTRWKTFWISTASKSQTTPPQTERAKRSVICHRRQRSHLHAAVHALWMPPKVGLFSACTSHVAHSSLQIKYLLYFIILSISFIL